MHLVCLDGLTERDRHMATEPTQLVSHNLADHDRHLHLLTRQMTWFLRRWQASLDGKVLQSRNREVKKVNLLKETHLLAYEQTRAPETPVD